MGISIDGPNLTLFTLNKQSPMGKLQRQENSHRSETSYSAVMHKGKVIFTLMCLTFVCFGSGIACNEALENGFRFVVNTTTVLKHLEICCNFLQKVEDFVLLHSFSICVKKAI